MTNKQDIVPVTLKSKSQHQMNNQKTQTKSTVAFQVSKESTTLNIALKMYQACDLFYLSLRRVLPLIA
ncbi:hypothetical protein GCM10012290_25750 [Halolactibacillus alkaliphilus]|uniref:Uncharacterized protein n=1 Tax=Halolactibacillus alkaliphilus TaxID=442899 RepID=A0A511X597_9BACI|nr:hypothetical protein [Halolactibacillus alkaliphilus]GEN58090.1 hypothetical protein HAL01_25540 [Halolactibacillus alkaliphilus]GGN76232.1 hypothetical protein GCM10012290_25750 [Halolactibacillus alkaliphilus]SFP13646.1 hypothetical protein SAMN05720591_1596 [Halolactibacillus alkaliphilus]